MTDTNRPPLWREMMNAYCEATDSVARETDTIGVGNAAEIRAVRDWLVPEEAPPLGPAGKERMALRALLTAEINRAERGE